MGRLPRALADELLEYVRGLEYVHMHYRGQELTARPKHVLRLRCPRAGYFYKYAWGQHNEDYAQEHEVDAFPDVLQRAAVTVAGEGHTLNHVIITRYTRAEQHIPWHHDQQDGAPSQHKSIAAGTTIYDVIVGGGEARHFQMGKPDGDQEPIILFQRRLGHGRTVTLTAAGNAQLKHRVATGDASKDQERFSIVFRTINSSPLV